MTFTFTTNPESVERAAATVDQSMKELHGLLAPTPIKETV